MALKVACPRCSQPHYLRVESAACEVKCPSCGRRFVPVIDVGVECPKCGSVILMTPGCSDRRLTCLECGHRLDASRALLRWLLILAGVTLATGALLVYSVCFAS